MSWSTVSNDLTGRKLAEHPAVRANGSSFEFKAAALVDLGRRVDPARAELEPAQARYAEACRRWAEAVAKLPRC